MAALTSNGVGTCGADDNQAQAGHLIAETIGGGQVTHSLTSEGHDASEDGTGRGTPIVATGFYMTQDPISSEEQVPCIGSKSVGNGVLTVTPLAIRGREHGAELEAGEPNAPYNALRAGDGGSPRQSLISIERHADTTVRRLTETECERLQGFPDGWTDNQSGSARYRQLGNSIAVPVVEWIAQRITELEDGSVR